MVVLAGDQGKYRRGSQASHRLHGLRAHEPGALPVEILLAKNYRQDFIAGNGKPFDRLRTLRAVNGKP